MICLVFAIICMTQLHDSTARTCVNITKARSKRRLLHVQNFLNVTERWDQSCIKRSCS